MGGGCGAHRKEESGETARKGREGQKEEDKRGGDGQEM